MERLTFKRLINFFLRGLLFVVPTALTIYVLVNVIQWMDGLIDIGIPGLGLVLMITAVTILGYLASLFITKPFFIYFERAISKVPLVNLIYTSLKDLMAAFVGEQKKFSKPVMVQMDKEGIVFKMGFITQTDLSELGMEGMVTVYLPHSYNFSGNHFIVPKDMVRPLNITGPKAMKYIVSGGVSDL